MRRRAAYLRGVHRPRVLAFAIAATAVAAACGGGTSGEPKQAQLPASTTATKTRRHRSRRRWSTALCPSEHTRSVCGRRTSSTRHARPAERRCRRIRDPGDAHDRVVSGDGPRVTTRHSRRATRRGGCPYPLVVLRTASRTFRTCMSSSCPDGHRRGTRRAAPVIPLLNGDAPGGASHADYGPANIEDFGFVVDEALRRAAATTDPHFSLFALVDKAQVAGRGSLRR